VTPIVANRSTRRAARNADRNASSPSAGGAVRRTSPASAGPNARAAVNCIELTRTALRRSDRGTSCGTNDCQAAVVIPAPSAEITTHTRMVAVVATPVAHVIQSAVAIDIINPCAQSSTVRRSCRSESDPASGPITVAGKKAAKALTPTSAVEWVSWSITYGTVTVCIHVPVFDRNPAVKNTENSRERNAASALDGWCGTAASSDSAAASTTNAESTCALDPNTCST